MKAPPQCGAVMVSSAAAGGRSRRSGRTARKRGNALPEMAEFACRASDDSRTALVAGSRVGLLARHVPHGVGVAAGL
jgi:hypothetical protein